MKQLCILGGGITAGFIMCLFGMVWFASAHGDGPSIEVPVDSYLLDIGYSPAVVEVGTQTRFDFLILDLAERTELPFDDVWVRIEKEGKLYFAGGLGRQRFGVTGLTYRFFEAGEYSVYVRFSHEGEVLADTTLSFPVAATTNESFFTIPTPQKIALLLIGVTAGVILTMLWLRTHAVKRQEKYAP